MSGLAAARNLVLGLTLLAALPVPVRAAWLPRFGIEAGPNLARIREASFGFEQSWAFGGSAAIVARWEPAPLWSLEAAPGWERATAHGEGWTTAEVTGGAPVPPGRVVLDYEQSLRFDRVVLPVRAAFRPDGGPWSLEAGVVPAWTAHVGRSSDFTTATVPGLAAARMARRAVPAAAIFEDVGTFDSTDWTSLIHRWDVALAAGAGVDRAIGTRVLRLRLRWQEGMVDLGTHDQEVRLRSVSATAGLLW